MKAAAKTIGALPGPISDLAQIASNLAWSWNREARELFRRVDPSLWDSVAENPVQFLREVDPARLAVCASDEGYLSLYARVRDEVLGLADNADTWFVSSHGERAAPVAYFCAEFGVHDSVPIYSGGLGVLAGDHVKSASDLGVPMVGVGLLYARGYFAQRIGGDGWQRDEDETLHPGTSPLRPLHDADAPLVSVEIEGRTVGLGVWELAVGRTRVLLLDADLPTNDDADRGLTGRLYGAGEELRLKQEWILGVGGVRALQALEIEPGVWHANEGHAAFMMVERARIAVSEGRSFADVVPEIRARSVFTTHTPVPAGHDRFDVQQLEDVLGAVWEPLGISRDDFLRLGFAESDGADRFHMTATAIRLSASVNGVSRKHGEVTRDAWRSLWGDRRAADVPVGAITNGVHRWTWMAPEVQAKLDSALGEWWTQQAIEDGTWDGVLELDAEEVWDLHGRLKRRCLGFLTERARRRWQDSWDEARHLVAAGPLLDPDVLTIGFARRFATYKRADLLLRDEERFLALINDARRPVQFVYAGKAHPADDDGKRVLQRIWQLANDPRSSGRVAFVEGYDMRVARALLSGVDLWLNTPRVPKEASGTSGMKAALNLVPQIGTLDGWWLEGYTGDNGWAVPPVPEGSDTDEWDWDQLFMLLEDSVVPAFYERDTKGLPTRWIDVMKRALWVAGRDYTTDRMVREYAERYYLPAWEGALEGDDPPTG